MSYNGRKKHTQLLLKSMHENNMNESAGAETVRASLWQYSRALRVAPAPLRVVATTLFASAAPRDGHCRQPARGCCHPRAHVATGGDNGRHKRVEAGQERD